MTVATQLKSGNTVLIEGNLLKIEKLTHITPGKGNAIVQAILRNVKTGVKTEKRFRSAEDVETVDVFTRHMQYLYSEGDVFHFMDTETFEQYEIKKDFLAEAVYYLIANTTYDIALYENQPIGIDLPPRVILKITETSPAEKGVQGKTKHATLETGLSVTVPLFLNEGENIVVNTSDNSYIERAKD